MKRAYLNIVVFVSGAAILAVEILGTRILAPFYGASLFLWSALISVTLAALSLGYVLGGRWADKGAVQSRISYLLSIAGLWLLLTPWLKQPVLTLIEPFGLRTAVLAASVILFFFPLMLLGMVTPYAIKLKTSRLEVVGQVAGNLYAISTVASVLSALSTGFFLIPNVGANRLTLIIGTLLLLTAAFGLSPQKSSILRIGMLIAGLLGLLLTWKSPLNMPQPEKGLIAVEQSPYGELRVLDTEEGRHLLIDGGIHSLADTSTWESLLPYVAVMEIPKHMFAEPGAMLLIGLGGGSIVKSYYSDGWSIDAVEIDPKVIRFAYTYFDLKTHEASLHNVDGRQFLLSRKGEYDLIILDAFGSGAIPFDLVSRESFSLMAEHLNEKGIVALNTESVGWHSTMVRGLAATLRQVFSQVIVLPIAEPPNTLGNVILLASNRPLELLRELDRNYANPGYIFSMEYQKNHSWDNRFSADITNAVILTDDLNPVDVWAEATNLVARKSLHKYFEASGLSW